MTALKVADLMTTKVATIGEDDNLDRATQLMKLGGVRHLPVMRDGRLVGLVSHRDALLAQESPASVPDADYRKASARALLVREVMTRDLRIVEPTTPLVSAAELLQREHIGCLPVVEEGSLVGILTESDFVRYVVHELSDPTGG